MALADGKVRPEEEQMLRELLTDGEAVAEFLTEAGSRPLVALLHPTPSYPDRFFICLRAANLAHVDADFDLREELLFRRLVRVLDIEAADRELIERYASLATGPDDDLRVETLHRQSSFC